MTKTKFGTTLSNYVRNIGLEKTEPYLGEVDQDPEIISKVEKLARLIWRIALGWTEKLDDGAEVIHKPDKQMMTVLWDRLEGRVPTSDKKADDSKASVADRVSEQSKKRLNNMAGGDSDDRAGGT